MLLLSGDKGRDRYFDAIRNTILIAGDKIGLTNCVRIDSHIILEIEF